MGRIIAVNHRGIFLEALVISVLGRLLQCRNRLRIVKVVLAIRSTPHFVLSDAFQICVHRKTKRIKGTVVMVAHVLLNLFKSDTADGAHGVRKVKVNHVLRNSHRLKNLRRLIGLYRAYSHLRRNLHDAVQKGRVVVVNRSVIVLVQNLFVNQLGNALVRKIGIHRPGTIAQNHRRLMHVPNLRALKHNGNCRPLFRPNQILLHRAYRKQGRNCYMVLVHTAVAQNHDCASVVVLPVNSDKKLVQGSLQRRVGIIKKGNRGGLKSRLVQVLDFNHVHAGKNRMLNLKHTAAFPAWLKHVSVASQIHGRVGDNLFAE